ncbi:hypothetical protein LXA43DRAFT_1101794 [Ganoderma leucocontextum]|nr:hypothetical protein LXA43DRAFT_1101794 [Ganoderma leucocontextum]
MGAPQLPPGLFGNMNFMQPNLQNIQQHNPIGGDCPVKTAVRHFIKMRRSVQVESSTGRPPPAALDRSVQVQSSINRLAAVFRANEHSAGLVLTDNKSGTAGTGDVGVRL